MYRNFIQLAAATIKIKLLNVDENKKTIIEYIDYAKKAKIDVLTFQELTLTGASGGELIRNRQILDKSLKALIDIAKETENSNLLATLGLPLDVDGRVYNVMSIVHKGRILGFAPKINLNSQEEKYFDSFENDKEVIIGRQRYILSPRLFIRDRYSRIRMGIDFEDDLVSEISPSSLAIAKGANIILVPGSRPDHVYSYDQRLDLLKSKSRTSSTAIAYAGPSSFESSTNSVHSADRIIVEDGRLLARSKRFQDGLSYIDVNLDELGRKSHRNSLEKDMLPVLFEAGEGSYQMRRKLDAHPFIPEDKRAYNKKMQTILELQSEALIRRLENIQDKKIFLGLSGGLDSSLALIVASLSYFKMGLDSKDIHAVVMPGLASSKRTVSNAEKLAKGYRVSLDNISINESVYQHFKDIDHPEDDYSTVYENAQARERTQILMDLANKHGGIVLGTGNMSELALGWATYNGDHMSMYAVNSGLPKTLLREVVRFVCENSRQNKYIYESLSDILETPISPELLPTDAEGKIAQKTEETVGPYELHDFFLYHFIRNRSSLEDVEFMANMAFDNYSKEEIKKWLDKFVWRFSTQQFKRSCLPDGPMIEDFSLNPRNGLIMASDIDPYSFYKRRQNED